MGCVLNVEELEQLLEVECQRRIINWDTMPDSKKDELKRIMLKVWERQGKVQLLQN